jgi:hypothetical protein
MQKTYDMPLKTGAKFEFRILSVALVVSMALLAQCGKKPGHDKTPYLLKKKLKLTSEQAGEVESIITMVKGMREEDRRRHAGDDEALLKAARARRTLEQEKIESVLDEGQKARFRQFMAEQEVADRTLIIADGLGLDRTTTNRIDKIVVKGPAEEGKIEEFLTEKQKGAYRRMIDEERTEANQ